MSWMQKLYETYDNCSSEIGLVVVDESGKKRVPLLPIAHTTQNVQIEITIDMEGNFKHAELVPPEDASTIIPCTESSSGRTSGTEPHPLCDGLQYIAADYVAYGGSKKPDYKSYEKLLRNWCESSYSHPKAHAVLSYISKGNVIRDLIDAQILMINKEGKLLDKWDKKLFKNAPTVKQDSVFIRFVVWEPGNPQSSVWNDKSLHDSWIKYYTSTQGNAGLCYVLGESKPCAFQHPRFLRTSGDGAKLISSNDKDGFTFRGRFSKASEACGVSYEVSQKAHYALKWLIGRQGKVFYEKNSPGLTVIAWAVTGKPVPDPLNDSMDFLDFSDLPGESDIPAYTAQEFASKLNQKVAGYHAVLSAVEDIVVMAIDSATPGRMAISYYREQRAVEFLECLEKWHRNCCWMQQYYDFGKKKRFIGAPAPRIITEAAYSSNVNDKLRKSTIERLLPCIVDGRRVPRDLVETLIRRASNRIGMKDDWEWETTLGVACALFRKYYIDYKGEDVGMALDHARITRDYLYGRLLAVADVLEQKALSKTEKNRPTNAARYMNRFADRPFGTWRYIELALEPYKARLGERTRYFQNQLDEIMGLFAPDDFCNDKKLNGEFLLGYHCQRQEMLTFSKPAGIDENETEVEGE